MPRLVQDLKHEHALITDLFKSVKDAGVSSKEGRERLLAAKKGLLGHLKKEDDKLYPVLKDAAKDDPRLQTTLNLFAKEMEEVSALVLKFFNKYSQAGASGMEFARDFGQLAAKLGSRIRKEENILSAEYDKLRQD